MWQVPRPVSGFNIVQGSVSTMEIFVALDLTPAQIRLLHDIAVPDTLHVCGLIGDDDQPHPAFRRCKVVFGNPPPDWLASAPRLRWVQLESTGFGEYASLGLTQAGRQTVFTNLAGFFAEPVAETCLAGILALCRGTDECARLKVSRTWLGEALRPRLRTLAGRKVVLFGFGSINRRMAELLQPFDCEITVFRSDWSPGMLDDALANADIVVCSAPDTPETRRVFDRERLGHMPGSALFVNVGRGSVVDEDALADQLCEGRISGAVIDVTDEEPLEFDHRFWDCPNLILTQHTAGGTENEIDRKVQVFAANLERFRSGRPLAGIVDFGRSY